MRFHGIHHKSCCMTCDEHERIHLIQCFRASVKLLGTMLKSPVPEQILSYDKKDFIFISGGVSGQGREWEIFQAVYCPS